ncbi:hypothetical protein PVAP13_9NG479400 [Panicum virgatum]|uniref:Uncharacterized protein n=1 Tax=Panicum virgatum TaxID=38727 RepID=A0A8T0MSM7_PANVG|nr:hypothetical protein PVAP13_9NG479400 [Panicum virgatum]
MAAAGRGAGRAEQEEEQKWPRMVAAGRGAGHVRSEARGEEGAPAPPRWPPPPPNGCRPRMASSTAKWLSPVVSPLLLCGGRLRLGPPRGGRPSPPPPRATAWRPPLAASASGHREEAMWIRRGAEVQGRGRGGGGAEEGAEEQGRGRGGVGGGAAVAAQREAGRAEQRSRGRGDAFAFALSLLETSQLQ